jgi:hypothetical protein
VNAWKFLRPGAISPITGTLWKPGVWVDAHAAPRACRSGIHACQPRDLAHWICEELWEIELEGAIEVADGVAGTRARLIAKVGAWAQNEAALRDACVARAKVHFDALGDARARAELFMSAAERGALEGQTAWTAYCAASVAAAAATENAARFSLYRAERAVQSAWIAEHVLKQSAPTP